LPPGSLLTFGSSLHSLMMLATQPFDDARLVLFRRYIVSMFKENVTKVLIISVKKTGGIIV